MLASLRRNLARRRRAFARCRAADAWPVRLPLSQQTVIKVQPRSCEILKKSGSGESKRARTSHESGHDSFPRHGRRRFRSLLTQGVIKRVLKRTLRRPSLQMFTVVARALLVCFQPPPTTKSVPVLPICPLAFIPALRICTWRLDTGPSTIPICVPRRDSHQISA